MSDVWICDGCKEEFDTVEKALEHENTCQEALDFVEKAKKSEEEERRIAEEKAEEDEKRRVEEKAEREKLRAEQAKLGILSSTHKSVWGNQLSWIINWDSDTELLGYPAYIFSSFLSSGRTISGWTGASKIQINGKKNEVIELKEALGYRIRRVADLDTYDSFEIKGTPNQYLMFLGFFLLPIWGIGLIPIIVSYFYKHWFMVMNFGHKSTTNERVALRIVNQDIDKATEFCENALRMQNRIPTKTKSKSKK